MTKAQMRSSRLRMANRRHRPRGVSSQGNIITGLTRKPGLVESLFAGLSGMFRRGGGRGR